MRFPPGQSFEGQDDKIFERGNPSESPGRPTTHNPDSEKDAGPITALQDTPFHSPLQKDGTPTFERTTEDGMPQRWSWWQVISGQKDAAEDTKGRGWMAAPFVFAGEFGERAASFGLQVNIINYFLYEMHMPLVSASTLATNFFGAAALATLGGAFLADAYLGRFLTFVLGSVFYLLGILVFTMSATIEGLLPQYCSKAEVLRSDPKCQESNTLQMSVLYISLALQCLGSGGIQPCSAPFGADQFDRSSKKHAAQLRHYFNWYYLSAVVAMITAATAFVYIMNVSWGWGGGISAVVMAFSLCIFVLGTRYYVYLPPYGSPLTRMLQIVVAAVRKRKCTLPEDPGSLYQAATFLDKESLQGIDHEVLIHTDQFRFLDKAAIVEEVDGDLDGKRRFHPWRLATVNQVEEMKQMLRIIPVWISTIIVSLVIVQTYTLIVQESMTMKRKLGTFTIPAASLTVFASIALILFIPFYDLVLIKILRKFTGHPKGLAYLQRIGVGIFLNILVTVALGLVEVKRREVASQQPDGSTSVLPMSAFWLLIPILLSGIAESFLLIGQLEYFYDEAPKSIKSMSTAFLWSSIGMGSFLSSVLVNVTQSVTSTKGSPTGESGWLQTDINHGHLDYFYWVLTGLSFLNFLYFLLVAWWYRYKKTSLNDSSLDDRIVPVMSQDLQAQPF